MIHTTRFKTMPDLTGYLTTQETASRLGFHVITIRHLLRAKKLSGQKVGQMWFVSRDSVEKYIKDTEGMEKHDPRRSPK